MRVLYVTRKFPPSVGGMEKAAYELHRAMKDLADVRLIAYGGPNTYLPVVYPLLFLRALFAILWWRPTIVYLQDGAMAPMGFMLRLLTLKPMVMTIHGLEVTYNSKLYKSVMKRMMPSIQRVVVGSGQTESVVRARYPRAPISKVAYGVRDVFYLDNKPAALRRELAEQLGMKPTELDKRKLLLTTGRLVKRKGAKWFVDKVMPEIAAAQPRVLYLVAGKGPDEEDIRHLIKKHGLKKQVQLLGYISDEVRDLLYNTADLFIMPNIPVTNDLEGFGLVAVEAASCGTPVIASGIEGIVDAVVDGRTGRLLPAEDVEAYLRVLLQELKEPSFDRQQVRNKTLAHYSWQKAAKAYLGVFEQVVKDKS